MGHTFFPIVHSFAMESPLLNPSSARKNGHHQQSRVTVFCSIWYFIQLLFNLKSISLIAVVEAVPVVVHPSPSAGTWPTTTASRETSTFTAVQMVKVNLSMQCHVFPPV